LLRHLTNLPAKKLPPVWLWKNFVASQSFIWDLLIKKFSAVAQELAAREGFRWDHCQLPFYLAKKSVKADNCSGPYRLFCTSKKTTSNCSGVHQKLWENEQHIRRNKTLATGSRCLSYSSDQ